MLALAMREDVKYLGLPHDKVVRDFRMHLATGTSQKSDQPDTCQNHQGAEYMNGKFAQSY